MMPTNLAINDQLLEEAFRLGGHKTKRATVDEALKEYIERRVKTATPAFLARAGSIKVGPGDPVEDVRRAREMMGLGAPPSATPPADPDTR